MNTETNLMKIHSATRSTNLSGHNIEQFFLDKNIYDQELVKHWVAKFY